MEVDLLVKPIVDTKGFDAGIKKLQSMAQKGVSGLSSQRTADFENLATRLMTSLMISGRAKTSTQARIQIEKVLGAVSGSTKSVLRGAQNMSDFVIKSGMVMPYGSFSERQIARWKPDLANAASAYKDMLASYTAFKAAPSERTQEELLKTVEGVYNQLSNISKDRKAEIKTFGRIEKDTKAIHKEATNFSAPLTPSRATTAVGMLDIFKTGGKWLLGILGIGSVLGGIKKWLDFGISGTKEGSSDLLEQAMYGSTRNIAIGRTRAKMYGLDESVTAAPERYALDFRQRMMYGEVSDKEWIALSRMGGLGQMIISGAASQNPEAFQRGLEKWIESNRGNEAMVRQTLNWLGLSPQLMKYGAIQYSEDEKSRLESAYAENIKAQKDAAVLIWKTADEFNKFIADLRAGSASMIAAFADTPESRRRLAASWGLSGYSAPERGMVIRDAEELAAFRENYPRELGNIDKGLLTILTGNPKYLSDEYTYRPTALDYAHPGITNYNTFYINGGNTDEVTNAVKQGIYYNNNSGAAQ